MAIRLRDHARVVFFTGAGVSAESGVPTYRGQGGIWKEYDYGRYACQEAFDEDPERVWEFHNYRRALVDACAPNAAHRLIALAEASHPDVCVVTQNIDGLHQLAGSRRVLELHGSLWRVRCDACGARRTGHESPFVERTCTCGAGIFRPDITWFGDALDGRVFGEAQRRCEQATLFIAIGTSASVYPAAMMPEVAKAGGALMVEVNLERTPASPLYAHHWLGPAGEVLPRELDVGPSEPPA